MAFTQLPAICPSDHAKRERLLHQEVLIAVQPLGSRGIDVEVEQIGPPTPSLMFHVKHPPPIPRTAGGLRSFVGADDDEPVGILTPGAALYPLDARHGVVNDLPFESIHGLQLLLLTRGQRPLCRFTRSLL